MSTAPSRVREQRIPRWIACFGLVLSLTTTFTARAETSVELTLARALFEEGVGLAESGDWSAAADRFERAYAIKPTPGVAYNWASALVALHKLVHASELLDQALRDESADETTRAECEKLRTEITPRIARLRVTVDEDAKPTTELWVDGFRWPRPAWGVASPMDPGAHRARRLDAGREVANIEVDLTEGEQRTVALSLPKPSLHSTRSITLVPAAAPAEKHRDQKPLYKNVWLWTGVGVAVVAGVVVGAVRASHKSSGHAEPAVAGNTGEGVIRW